MTEQNKKVLVIAADLGHSAAKVTWTTSSNMSERNRLLIPTVVKDAINLSNDEAAKLAEKDTVELEGKKYFVGETALRQYNPEEFSGKERDWIINGYAHDAILLACVKKVMEAYYTKSNAIIDKIVLVLGLPTAYYASQKDNLIQRAEKLLRAHLIENIELKVGIKAQSEAPLYLSFYERDGKPNSEKLLKSKEESYVIVECGHFTVDFSHYNKGQVVHAHGDSIPNGVHSAYAKVKEYLMAKGWPTNVDIIRNVVEKGKIKIAGEEIDMSDIVNDAGRKVGEEAVEKLRSILGNEILSLDQIILAGGGAPLISSSFVNRYPKITKMLEDPRWAVSEGCLRVGLFQVYRAIKQG